jgi:hypothetical protein
MADQDLLERLRTELPRLLREHPEVRHELWGLMLEAFPSREEFVELLREIRALRGDMERRFQELRADMDRRFQEVREEMDRRFQEVREEMDRRFQEFRVDMDRRFEEFRVDMDRRFEELRVDMDRRFQELRVDMDRRFEAMDRRFEAMDRRFEAMDRRFDAVIAELREQRVHLASLGARVGAGLERAIQAVVEEFAGQAFPVADRLVLTDEAGEVFGVPRARIEFDLYAHDGTAYLVEVKAHLKPSDVLAFHKKAEFAARRLDRPVTRLIIALSMERGAAALMQELGIRYRVRAVVDVDVV